MAPLLPVASPGPVSSPQSAHGSSAGDPPPLAAGAIGTDANPRVPFLPDELEALQFRFLRASPEELRVGDLSLLLAEYKYMSKLLMRLKKVVCGGP